KLGTLAIDRGFMQAEEVERVNRIQRTVDKKFGELAVEQGLLTPAQVQELLAQQKQDRLMLGEALVQKGILSLADLSAELAAFKADQEGVPESLAAVYRSEPDAATLEVFADVLCKMMLRIAHETVKPGPCHPDAAKARHFDFTVYQAFHKGFEGLFGVSFTADLLMRISAKMLSEPIVEPDDLALDGITEFVNIVSGNVCARLSALGRAAEIFPPKVHDNRQGSLFNLEGLSAKAKLVITPLLHPESGVELWVIDRTPAPKKK
ncbi:MAG: chemotaxis protein CheX, partial [Planctomycetes bacterium]|nr:chemotaxis protein CheX [Planctomycetota bacterium]